ncbi:MULTISPECIES: hypothetical protein [Cupriavidus]|uniref:Uncharacterized protein n=1 Tax=Cupriavidus taiwanensis (strain DSM 17343 / BCRC 17206 / CCUG 44338 / CIP 107171 / LMG 19424 / R1) TaxID=977880 RepID=B2AJK0_CUPTR|nr:MULTISPECIES: hypothetical protein [Cupriavidus]MCO4865620.1 hypothetical protein [Cupriavidus sp. WGlv3]MCO4893340.1 hypothetical protein [Cupriavidus sp. WGtm5]CAP64253.1 hypothetical protein pRALTA_0638 [Cupriavidus taiwanensis LMG 19424]
MSNATTGGREAPLRLTSEYPIDALAPTIEILVDMPSLMLDMLSLEREGRQHELLERRKTFRDLHPGLFSAYIRMR